MNDDGRQYQGESEIDNLVKRFERMVEDNDQHYFDLEEFEAIIGHYLSFGLVYNAKKVLQYASTLFPENLTLQLREAQIMASMGKQIKAIPLRLYRLPNQLLDGVERRAGLCVLLTSRAGTIDILGHAHIHNQKAG